MTNKKTQTKVERNGSVPEITQAQKVKAGVEKSVETQLEKKSEAPGEKTEKKDEKKKAEPKKSQKVKKEVVHVFSTIPCSMKESRDICKFIKHKPIGEAIDLLEQVAKLKKAVPMKGEIAHRRGMGMMSGRFPQKTAKYFIASLKTLKGNANNHEVNNPKISEAFANQAYRPAGRFGSVKKKRTHIKISAKESKIENKKSGGLF